MSGVLAALLCAACWATGSISVKNLSQKLDPFTLNAPRSLVGGLSMLALTFLGGRAATYDAVTGTKLFFMLASIIIGGAIGDSLYISSLSRIGVSQAFPIANTYPALTLLFGVLFLQEAITWMLLGGLVLTILGIMMMSRSAQELNGKRRGGVKSWGVPMALMASLLWAISSVMVAPGVEGLDPIMVSSIRTPALSLVLWGVVGMRRSWPTLAKLSFKEWMVIVFGGFIGWGLGGAFYVLSVCQLGATRSAILTSTAPLFALPLSVVLLRERINWLTIVGTGVTVAGIILVS